MLYFSDIPSIRKKLVVDIVFAVPHIASPFYFLLRKKSSESSIPEAAISTISLRRIERDLCRQFLCFVLIVLSHSSVWADENIFLNEKIFFNIPRQNVVSAIIEFAKQADVTFIYPLDKVRQRIINQINGYYTREEALNILLEQASLEGSINQDKELIITEIGAKEKEENKNRGGREMVDSKSVYGKLAAMLLAVGSGALSAQEAAPALEEIVVTAQRRVETLQEVPISIEVFSGAQIESQGYRNLTDLSKYSASVSIVDDFRSEQTTTIRGFGTAGTSLLLEAAAPIFLDGINFGAPSMVRNAFMDVESVEVLKGPQPLHFGMNATAGAFNIRSRRPTAEWEGNVAAEMGIDKKREFSGAIGGPLTESLGIRIAAMSKVIEGPAKSYFDGHKFPEINDWGGRISLQWTPSDKFNVFSKFEISSHLQRGGEIIMGCFTEGRAAGFPGSSPLGGGVDETIDRGNIASIVVPAPSGVTGGAENVYLNPDGAMPKRYTGDGSDCFQGDYAFTPAGTPMPPPNNVDGSASGRFLNQGTFDAIAVLNAYLSAEDYDGTGFNGLDGHGLFSGISSDIDSWNAVLEANYLFDNGVNVQSQTGMVRFLRGGGFTSYPPGNLLGAPTWRKTDMYQYSQQIRIESPDEGYDLNFDIPGGINLEFMGGGFWQFSENDIYSHNSMPDFERGQRFVSVWEDATWLAGFWDLTFNLMDDQLALEIGGRYTDVSKEGLMQGWGAAFIFDEVPCDTAGTDSNPATCAPDPDFKRVHSNLTTETYVDPVTGRGGIGSPAYITGPGNLVRVDSPRIFVAGADLNNLWTSNGWFTRGDRTQFTVPLNWRSPGGAAPVGLTAPVYSNANGPWGKCDSCLGDVAQSATDYDTQVVLSYTPNRFNRDHTFYAKYVEAFKGPATNTSTVTIPGTLADLLYSPEYSESWELGARGQFFDRRVRYDITLFKNDFWDLQTLSAAPVFDPGLNSSISLNAGNEKVDGLEFGLEAAATQNLTLNFAGAFLNARYGEFDGGGCFEDEIIAAAIDASTSTAQGGSMENRSPAEVARANQLLNALGPTRRANLPARSDLPQEFFVNGGCRLLDTPEFAAGSSSVGAADTIDRSGMTPSNAPDWKFVLGFTYTRPILDVYEAFINATGFIEAEKKLIVETRELMFKNGDGDISITGGFGSADGSWRVAGYIRNILERRPVFNPEYELEQKGYVVSNNSDIGGGIGPSSFMSYGIRLEYQF